MVRDCPTEEEREDTLIKTGTRPHSFGLSDWKRKRGHTHQFLGQGHTHWDYPPEEEEWRRHDVEINMSWQIGKRQKQQLPFFGEKNTHCLIHTLFFWKYSHTLTWGYKIWRSKHVKGLTEVTYQSHTDLTKVCHNSRSLTHYPRMLKALTEVTYRSHRSHKGMSQLKVNHSSKQRESNPPSVVLLGGNSASM